MTWFSLFISFLLFHVAFTTGYDIDWRELSIDEYINLVNPPAVHKYVDEHGQTILCVKWTDQISVKYSQDPVIRALTEPPKSEPETWTKALSDMRGRSISTVRPDSGGPSISTVRSDSGGPSISTVRPDSGGPSISTVRPDSGGPSVFTVPPDAGGPSVSMVPLVKHQCPEGTVPHIEIKREVVERFGSVRQFLNSRGRPGIRPSRGNVDTQDGMENQHSVVRFDSPDEPISKAAARPNVAPNGEISLSKIWINNENEGKQETIEVEASLFDALSHGANQFHGGGEVSHNSKTRRPMTVTDIGSCHFPGKGVTFAMGHTNVLSWWG